MEVSIVGLAQVTVTMPNCPRYDALTPVDYEIIPKRAKK